MMTFLYDVILILFSVFYLPYLFARKKWHKEFFMRLGFLNKNIINRLSADNIWIHAVSVGEVLAIVDLVKNIQKQYPQYKIVCSTVTKTGNIVAKEQLKDVTVIYAPLDFSFVAKKFVRIINPRLYFAAETEIWPNIYHALSARGVPIMQINGRISDNAFKGYKRIKYFVKSVLSCVDIFCMQSQLDAQRIIELGANKSRVKVVGNIKFDVITQITEDESKEVAMLKNEKILIAGSTHPQEEEIILEIYKKLLKDFDDLRLVIAPRHVERTQDVLKIVNNCGFDPVKYSNLKDSKLEKQQVIVVDKIGKLRGLYNVATLVFIGKTFKVGGGQNMIEPAFFSKPTLVGPLTENFKDIMRIFKEENAIVQVDDPIQMYQAMVDLLKDDNRRKAIGQAARQCVERYSGPTKRTLKEVQRILD